MKKILIRLASTLVLDVLIEFAVKQRATGGSSPEHVERWTIIIGFLLDMRSKGLPL